MALQTLRLRPQKVDNVFLLFPTLSHISKGSAFSRASAVITSLPGAARLAALLVFLMRFIFPIPLLAIFVRFVYAFPGTSLSTTLAKFFNPASVESFTYLAKYEFRDIRELDVDTLTKYAKRVTAYYAIEDGWVPNFAREEAMRIITESGGDAHLCNEGFPHSFSLGTVPPFLSVNAVNGQCTDRRWRRRLPCGFRLYFILLQSLLPSQSPPSPVSRRWKNGLRRMMTNPTIRLLSRGLGRSRKRKPLSAPRRISLAVIPAKKVSAAASS